MPRKRTAEKVNKIFSIIAIYLIISLTFFTARTFAVLEYKISGDAGTEGYARKTNDAILVTTTSNSNVSFVSGSGTSNYKETPLRGCTDNSGIVTCSYTLDPEDISANLNSIPFTLKQQTGTPQTKNGILYIDKIAPIEQTPIRVTKNATGLLFEYDFIDYLALTTETGCLGSGIGNIEINVQDRPVYIETITTKNCTITGSYFANLAGTNTNVLRYSLNIRDRSGNEYLTTPVVINGDFTAPTISDSFKIIRDEKEIIEISSSTDTQADIEFTIEDSNATSGIIYADLSILNINPAISIPYKTLQRNIADICIKDAGNIYNCAFKGIRLKPQTENLEIIITAVDSDGNSATKTLTGNVVLKNNPGQVQFLGPLRNHCTTDLALCYTTSGMNLFKIEIDPTSSYEKTIVNLGVDSTRTFAICRLTEKWDCTSIYNVPKDSTSISLVIADSVDDFGNRLQSDLERTVYVDDDAPTSDGKLIIENNNNNNNCSVSGDELKFTLKAQEIISPELKIYVNTSNFTTIDTQYGTCENSGDDWDCSITIEDFSAIPNTLVQDIVLEDLAGNKKLIPYTFRVCKASSEKPPNVVYGFDQTNTPKIDRRTAGILPIKTYISGNFKVMSGAQLMYIQIDRCTSTGMDGLDVMSTGHYFTPSYGSSSTLALNIGHEQAQLTEGSMIINCTISARINIGETVYNSDEKETILLHVDTFNQPLGMLDDATIKEIKYQKKALRDLDSDMKVYETIDKILGTICDISDIFVKIDSVLQAIKAVMYPICIILIDVYDIGEPLWAFLHKIFAAFDKVVDGYVWPTGGEGTSAGYIWKYMCIAYNCRFYTLSGLVDIGFDAKGFIKTAQAKNGKDITSEIPIPVDDKSKGPILDPEGNPYKDNNGNLIYPQMTDANGDLIYDTKITHKDGSVETITHEIHPDTPLSPAGPTGNIISKTVYPNGDTKIITGTSDGGTTEYNLKYSGSGGTPEQNFYSDKDSVSETIVKDKEGKIISTTQIYTNGETFEQRKIISQSVNPTVENGGATIKIVETQFDNHNNVVGKPIEYYVKPNAQTQSGKGIIGGVSKLVSGILSPGKLDYSLTKVDPKTNQPVSVKNYVASSYQNLVSGKSSVTAGDEYTLHDMEHDYSLYSIGAQGAVYADIERQDWIINPYKSVYYDGLCLPAILYNMQKERQIRCMYLSCMMDSESTGMPVSICKNLYATNNCLYLESAQHVLNDNLWSQIGKGLVQQGISYAMGYAVQWTFRKACGRYIEDGEGAELVDEGWYSAGCGLFGAALKWQEVAALLKSPSEVMKNLFKGAGVDNPAKIHDYCEGGKLYEE